MPHGGRRSTRVVFGTLIVTAAMIGQNFLRSLIRK